VSLAGELRTIDTRVRDFEPACLRIETDLVVGALPSQKSPNSG
jgi:hypothetical protein